MMDPAMPVPTPIDNPQTQRRTGSTSGVAFGTATTNAFGTGVANNGTASVGYGSRVGEMWRAFQHALSAYVDTPQRASESVTGARATFHGLEVWLSQNECLTPV